MKVLRIISIIRYDWPLHFSLLLTNWLPDNVPFLRLRGFIAGLFLGSCGGDLRLGRNVTFYNPGQVHVRRHVYLAQGCWIMAAAPIRIGDEVVCGPYCVIASANHSRKHGSYRYGTPHTAAVDVGRGCWLAAHVVVTAGSTIGDGTLVAAGAVVVQDLPGNVLCAGMPAKSIRAINDD